MLRWTVPVFLATLLAASVGLAHQHPFYLVALVGQLAFYGAAMAGYRSPRLMALPFVRIPLFFVNVNLSILCAWADFLRGRRPATWQPTSAADATQAASGTERRSA